MATGYAVRAHSPRLGWLIGPCLLAFFASGCLKNVKQDAKTGKDGKAKTAKKIKMEDGEGVARDILTYPGGDRVDWRFFELDKPGNVEINLKWKPPRPGLDLSMNVFDGGFNVLKRAKPNKSSVRKPRKAIELANLAPGKYYIQVYASERGDAGDYTLTVSWTPGGPQAGPAAGEDVPNPPTLAKLPGAPSGPGGGPSAGGPLPACAPGQQPGTPPTCAPPCPPGVPAGTNGCVIAPPPECGPGQPPGTMGCVAKVCPPGQFLDQATAQCKTPQVKLANIIQKSQAGNDVLIIIDKGQEAGVAKGWMGVVLKGNSGQELRDSTFTVQSVTADEAHAKIRKLSIGELGDNSRVRLTAPLPGP